MLKTSAESPEKMAPFSQKIETPLTGKCNTQLSSKKIQNNVMNSSTKTEDYMHYNIKTLGALPLTLCLHNSRLFPQ